MKKILVIDDVPGNRAIFADLLEDEYNVFEAGDGLQGLEVAERERPDLIFLDVSMPGMGGLETIRELRRHPQLYAIPVVAITAHSLFSARKAMDGGCNDFLLKPLAPHKIQEKIDQWIC
jgi:CheY-like chemotaxis protein